MCMYACVKWVWPLPDLSFTVPSWSSLLQHNRAPFILSIALSDWATVHLLCSGLSFILSSVFGFCLSFFRTHKTGAVIWPKPHGEKSVSFNLKQAFIFTLVLWLPDSRHVDLKQHLESYIEAKPHRGAEEQKQEVRTVSVWFDVSILTGGVWFCMFYVIPLRQ